MSGIRVTYSGLISFAMGITSVITGLIFTVIVTRRLTPAEFGTWNLIGGLITYVIVVEPVISYWVTRQTARNITVGKSAILTSGVFSSGAILAYFIIAYFVASKSNANENILIFATILIPLMFLNRTLTSINLSLKPHSISYSLIIFDVVKIVAGVFFVYFLNMNIFGAIISTSIAYVSAIVLLSAYAREEISGKINKRIIIKWIRKFWLPLYNSGTNFVFSLDVLTFSVLSGGVIGLAYYSAAASIASIVANSGLISQALYPKLLEGGKKEHLQENLMRFFYFSLPLVALCIVFSRAALFILNPLYVVAVPVSIFLTMRSFFNVLAGILFSALQGIERVDISEESRWRDFVRSKLFTLPTFLYIEYVLYVIILGIGILLLKPITHDNIGLVIYWSIISLIIQIPFTVLFIVLAKKHFRLTVDWSSFGKYLAACICSFSLVYILVERFLVYDRNVLVFVPTTLLFSALGVGGYVLITYVSDSRTKMLFKSILAEFRQKNT